MNNFIHFPSRPEILERLKGNEDAPSWRDAVFEIVAARLGSQVMDSAAFAFVLTEILYEHSGVLREAELELMTEVVMALTGDRQLAISVLQTVEEQPDLTNY